MSMKKNKKRWPLILLVFLLVVGSGLLFAYQQFNQLNNPITNTSEEVSFTVASGTSVSKLLDQLEEKEIIKNAMASKIYLQLNPVDVQLKAGDFVIDKAWSLEEILLHMSDGKNIVVDTFRLTFIDGQWAKDYAMVIENHFGYSQEEVLELWNDRDYVTTLIDTYEVLTPEILSEDVEVLLEGYLAPNTYEFYKDASIQDITKRLLDQSEQFYLNNKALFDASNLSIHEVFNLSSIVQSEAAHLEDMKNVASVFFNRLALPMRLESSVTVCYALGEYNNWQECERNVSIQSPYNTYINDGLPIGPIANPGENALNSVLSPNETDYYFFLTEMFGETKGTFHYSQTYAQHSQLVNQYLRGNQ